MASTTRSFKGKRRLGDRSFGVLAVASAALVLAILALIALTTTTRAWATFRDMGVSFFTSDRWSVPDSYFGALAFIYGTVLSAAIALVLAVPVSIGIALFVTQVAPEWLKRPIVYVVDLLAVVPSVVFGLWGVLVLAAPIRDFYDRIHTAVDGIPVLDAIFGVPNGRSFATAGIILAIMITPIISSLSREVIATVPDADREGAFALGATRWEMIRGAVFPHSKGGLVGAVMLGLGRAMGETIAAALVIGSSPQITANIFASGDSMPAVIANQWGEADNTLRSALLALAVTLFILTIIVNLVAQGIVQRSTRRTQGAV
jgi:phosphate transport system permease protein